MKILRCSFCFVPTRTQNNLSMYNIYACLFVLQLSIIIIHDWCVGFRAMTAIAMIATAMTANFMTATIMTPPLWPPLSCPPTLWPPLHGTPDVHNTNNSFCIQLYITQIRECVYVLICLYKILYFKILYFQMYSNT